MDPQEWYRSVPPVTKTLFTSVMLTTLAGNFGLVSPMSLLFHLNSIIFNFEIWRLITAVTFFGKLSFPFLINVYFLYSYSLQLERGIFDGQRASMVYCVGIIWSVLLVIAALMGMQIVGVALSIAMIYVYCNVNPEVIVTFWFGMKMKAMYFPWVLTAFGILTGGSGVMELTGIFAGHIYYFLKFKYPETGGWDILGTPNWLKDLFPEPGSAPVGDFGSAPRARPFTGSGRRLGGDN